MAPDPDLATSILDLLARRAPTSSICPSDVAREVGPTDGWRDLMDPVRRAALDLASDGRVRITQGEREIADPTSARGPVRIRRGPRFEPPATSSRS